MTITEIIEKAAEQAAVKYPNRINEREDKTMAEVNIKDVKAFFEFGFSMDFAKEWRELSDTDKAEIKELVAAEINQAA